MGVKYQDYHKVWVNGRYVGEKMFSKDGTRTPTVTQDAIGEMGEATDANGLSINSDDGYDNIRETERMGTITPDVMAYENFSIFDESKKPEDYTKVVIEAGDVMGEDGKTIVLTEHNTPKHDIPEVNTASVDDDE